DEQRLLERQHQLEGRHRVVGGDVSVRRETLAQLLGGHDSATFSRASYDARQPAQQKKTVRPSCSSVWRAPAVSTSMPHTGSIAPSAARDAASAARSMRGAHPMISARIAIATSPAVRAPTSR